MCHIKRVGTDLFGGVEMPPSVSLNSPRNLYFDEVSVGREIQKRLEKRVKPLEWARRNGAGRGRYGGRRAFFGGPKGKVNDLSCDTEGLHGVSGASGRGLCT